MDATSGWDDSGTASRTRLEQGLCELNSRLDRAVAFQLAQLRRLEGLPQTEGRPDKGPNASREPSVLELLSRAHDQISLLHNMQEQAAALV